MYECRRFVANTHVRPVIVVEVDVSADDIPCMFNTVETPSGIDCLTLIIPLTRSAIALSVGLLSSVHRDGDVVRPEHGNILVAKYYTPRSE